jgi:hypothetical protein
MLDMTTQLLHHLIIEEHMKAIEARPNRLPGLRKRFAR